MVAVSGTQADPRARNADTHTDRGVEHAKEGLSPRVVRAQGSNDHNNGGGDSRRDRLVGAAYQRHRDSTNANQGSHAPRLERED